MSELTKRLRNRSAFLTCEPPEALMVEAAEKIESLTDENRLLRDVASQARDIHDWQWKHRDTYRNVESAVSDLELIIARVTDSLKRLDSADSTEQ